MSQQASSLRAILFALVANAGIAVSKLAAALYTGSGSMLAEAIHSCADCGNQVLLFIGLKQAQRPPDAEHPLGYGKLSYFWSFLVAILLFSLGGLFSVYEGVHKLQATEPLHDAWVGIVVLALSIALEFGSLLGCLREVRKLRGERPFWSWVRTTRNAELLVVLGEDTAALLGLTIALLFLGLATITGNVAYDAIGSICIGAVLIVVSIVVATRIKALIVGRSADEDLQRAIRAAVDSDPNIDQLLNAITLQLGPQVMLAAKVRMRAGISIEAAVAHINALERRIKGAFPEVAWCFVEPDDAD